MKRSNQMSVVSRRQLLTAVGTGVLAAAGVALASRPSEAKPEDVRKVMKKLIGDKQPKSGRVKLEMPQIAENGNTVPISITVESPMTPSDYVKAVHVFAEENPNPEVASFYFTPRSGRAYVSTRMRMLKTQNVVAVAEMSNGEVYMAKTNVKVTIGGCGG